MERRAALGKNRESTVINMILERRAALGKNKESTVINMILMTIDCLFLSKTAFLSIYLLLNPLLSKLQTQSSANKNNSCTA